MKKRPPRPRMYKQTDTDMPEEFRAFLIKLLKYGHVENNGNSNYRKLLGDLAHAGFSYAPNEKFLLIESEIVRQEVEHGQIVADLVRSLGEDPTTDAPIKQYLFSIPLESWVDIAWFHGIGDRVGLYVGIEWVGSTYEPLSKVAPRLEKEERFHAAMGIKYIKEHIKTPKGRKEAQDGLHKWWPAVLDMFGRSDSENSKTYVKWGIKSKSNEELRQKYIKDTVPILEHLGLTVPDHRANRRYL
jgi:ring-1,2-phenylacetyl-CoA epoxidase subunit PaaA